MEERQVDARGLQCPRPVMMTKKALDEMGAGVLRVLVTQEVQSRNVSQLAAAAGLKAEVDHLGDHYCVTIWKGASPGAKLEAQPQRQPERQPAGPTFFFGSDTLGRGNDELGRLLARLMIQTLADLDSPPQCIIFMNTGVRLVCSGSPVVEALRTLERKGTRILACGTCLDFLGLVDNVEVGTVSNMFDILQALTSAEALLTF